MHGKQRVRGRGGDRKLHVCVGADLHIVMCVGEAKLSTCGGKRRENRQKGGKEAQHTGKDHCFSQYVLGTAYPEPPFLTSREKVQKKSGSPREALKPIWRSRLMVLAPHHDIVTP